MGSNMVKLRLHTTTKLFFEGCQVDHRKSDAGTRIRNFTELPLGSKMNSMDAWMSPTGSSILRGRHIVMKCETQPWNTMDME